MLYLRVLSRILPFHIIHGISIQGLFNRKHIFANNTNVFFKCKDIKEITRIGCLLMLQLHQWFKSNKLTLNAEKSNFIVFRLKRNNLTNIPDQLQFENLKISRNNSVKYLGVTLDEHLTWNEHILDLCNKLKIHFKTFYCIRRYLNKEQVKSMYYALIYSYKIWYNSIWICKQKSDR